MSQIIKYASNKFDIYKSAIDTHRKRIELLRIRDRELDDRIQIIEYKISKIKCDCNSEKRWWKLWR